jgi:5-methylcytosine-specific restriction endonuclease McrA
MFDKNKKAVDRARFGRAAWKHRRLAVLQRDGSRCRMCGTSERLHAHHVIPWIDSKDDRLTNLVTLCSSCHFKADLALRKHGEILCENGGAAR